jgi:hypothetical protein
LTVRVESTPSPRLSPQRPSGRRRVLVIVAIGAVVVAVAAILIRAAVDDRSGGDDAAGERAALAPGARPPAALGASGDRTPSPPTPHLARPLGALSSSSAAAPPPPAALPDLAAGTTGTGRSPAAAAVEARGASGSSTRVAAGDTAASRAARVTHGAAPDAGVGPSQAAPAVATAGEAPASATVPDGGTRRAEQRTAGAGEMAKRGVAWQRSPAEGDPGSKLVAHFVASGGAAVKGRVADADGGKPSVGVVVEAHLGDSFVKTLTDASGAFRISGMLPGTRVIVWIIARSDTYVDERIDVAIPGEGETADAGVIRLLRGNELANRLEGWMGLFVSRRGHRNVVAAVNPWSPADRAGIEVGDILMSVDGRDIDGLGPRATGFLLRGPIGSRVTVSVQDRDGAVRRVEMERVVR